MKWKEWVDKYPIISIEDGMDENEARDGSRKAQHAEQLGHWQDHGLERQKASKEHHSEDKIRTGKPPFGQHVAVERAEHGGDRHRRHDHPERVEEEGPQARRRHAGNNHGSSNAPGNHSVNITWPKYQKGCT